MTALLKNMSSFLHTTFTMTCEALCHAETSFAIALWHNLLLSQRCLVDLIGVKVGDYKIISTKEIVKGPVQSS